MKSKQLLSLLNFPTFFFSGVKYSQIHPSEEPLFLPTDQVASVQLPFVENTSLSTDIVGFFYPST